MITPQQLGAVCRQCGDMKMRKVTNKFSFRSDWALKNYAMVLRAMPKESELVKNGTQARGSWDFGPEGESAWDHQPIQ